MIEKKSDSQDYLKYVDEIIKSFADEMKVQFNLQCDGSGGNMPRDVETLTVSFSMNRRGTIEESRELEVHVAEKFLLAINTNEKIRPFLREYPFTIERIQVGISFCNSCNEFFADGTIAYLSLIKGRIFYRIYDPFKQLLVEFFDEPYEEAQKIVQTKPLNHDLRHHQAKPYESSVDQMLDDFEKEVKKKWGLYAVAEGGKMADGIDEIAINFRTPHRATIEKARKLEIELTERLLELINSNEKIRPYLKEYPFTPNRTKISITFRKFDDTYYMDGSVAVVHQAGNKVFYLTKLPPVDNRYTIRPVPLSEETYEEAKQKLTK